MSNLTFATLFTNPKVHYKIPDYQRAYSWDEGNFEQFYNDIVDIKKISGPTNSDYSYYLGHFLFETKGNLHNIVDGQQRITTCIIFISAVTQVLRKKLDAYLVKEHDKEYCKKLEHKIMTYEETYLKINDRSRLETVDYDNNFFQDLIVDHKTHECVHTVTSLSQKAIQAAFNFFTKKLSALNEKDILCIVECLESAFITTYYVEGKFQAAQIFSYQNDRGKRLTNLEILKALFLLQFYRTLNEDDIEEEENNQDIKYLLNDFRTIYQIAVNIETDEDTVLNYFWRAFGPQGFNSRYLIPEVKKWLFEENEQNTRQKIKEFTSKLALAFQFVESFEKSNETMPYYLKCIDFMAASFPVLIRAKLIGAHEPVFQRLYKLMENLSFRSRLRGGRANITTRFQSNLIQNVLDSNSLNNAIDEVKRLILSQEKNDWQYWTDQQMDDALRSNMYNNPMINYFLWRYEESLCNPNQSNPKIKAEVFIAPNIKYETIDHIAPQTNPGPNNGYGTYDEAKGCIDNASMHSIGNLVLMAKSQNSRLQNKPFSVKLKVYNGDNLMHQQREICSFVSDSDNIIWDRDAIERRTNTLIERAREIWDIKDI